MVNSKVTFNNLLHIKLRMHYIRNVPLFLLFVSHKYLLKKFSYTMTKAFIFPESNFSLSAIKE